MQFLTSLDTTLLRAINQSMANPFFDVLMPFMSGNTAFFPLLIVLATVAIKLGGTRGAFMVAMMALAVLIASNWVCAPLKELFMRPRPAMTLSDIRLLTGNGQGMTSLPSCHATNWGAMTVVAWLFYARTWRLMVPLALMVATSRVYLGVHYPSDVLAGLIIGGATGWTVTYGVDKIWQAAGRLLFPSWWARRPSLLKAGPSSPPFNLAEASSVSWRHATWALLLILFATRLAYISSDVIGLSEDETYQWMWSKHLDWAYYSKPPMIAWVQWLGTHLWGDTAFGVRFMSPVLALAFGIMVWLFLHRRTSEQCTFWVLAAISVTPLFAVGATLLTVDAPTVLFHTAAVLSVWIAIERKSYGWWVVSGIAMALGFLSKFFSPFLWLGLLLFAWWTPDFRQRIGWKGPVTAFLLNALGTVPVIIWNASHGWITLTHLQERGGLDHVAGLHLEHLLTFLASIVALLNPVFCIAIAVVVWGFVRLKEKPPLWKFLFCSTIPVLLFYTLLACRAKAQPNWIAPVAPALFVFAALAWHARSQVSHALTKRFLVTGLVLGFPVVLFLHDTHLLTKAFGVTLSEKSDPLTRVRQGQPLAELVQKQIKILAREGPPVFIISDHYGRASLLNFYLPDAQLVLPEDQLSYVLNTDKPQNQYWFWPSYESRTGENAIFVMNTANPRKAPKQLVQDFSSVNSMGTFTLRSEGRAVGHVQLFVCHGKKPPETANPAPKKTEPSIEDDTAAGVALYSAHRFEEAVRHFQNVVRRSEQMLGPEHQQTLANRNNLANALNAMGRSAEAETEHGMVLAIRERLMGPDHAEVLMSRNNLATALLTQGKVTEAEAQYKITLRTRERLQGPDGFDVLKTCFALAACLEAQQKQAEALAWARRAETGWGSTLGPAHPATISARAARERIETSLKQNETAHGPEPGR